MMVPPLDPRYAFVYVQGQTETRHPVTRANGPQAPCDSDGTTIVIKIVAQSIIEQHL